MASEALLMRLSCFCPLSVEDRTAMAALCAGLPHHVPARSDLLREGDTVSAAHLLCDGWACRMMTMPDGRRQIAGFLMAGDLCGQIAPGIRLDHSVMALTDCLRLQIDPAAMERAAASHPGLGQALAVHDHVTGAMLRNWVLNLGRRNAFERIGHLFCELFVRLRCIGRGGDGRCPFPVTQVELAEATGLSPVHVNRVIRDIRMRGLLSLGKRELRMLDFERLAALVMFDDRYLLPIRFQDADREASLLLAR